MKKAIKSKSLTVGILCSFLLFSSPYLLPVTSPGKGELIGFVYAEDQGTPVKGITVKMRNISTGTVYESSETDVQGVFRLDGIDEGLYMVGFSTETADFNLENLIGIQAGETVKASFSLKPAPEAAKKKGEEQKEKKKGLAGFFLSPAGVVVIVAASAAIAYTVVKLTKTEEEESPFKK